MLSNEISLSIAFSRTYKPFQFLYEFFAINIDGNDSAVLVEQVVLRNSAFHNQFPHIGKQFSIAVSGFIMIQGFQMVVADGVFPCPLALVNRDGTTHELSVK